MKKSQGSWKWDEESRGLRVAAVVVSIWLGGLSGLAALIWINSAAAALAPGGAFGCEERLENLYLAGSFAMPGSGQAMNIWIGKARDGKSAASKLGGTEAAGAMGGTGDVEGVIAATSSSGCEATCQVRRFERFAKDRGPALMELECAGARLKTLRMPLHIQWARGKDGFRTTLRMGSSIYGMEEAPLRILVNRYAVASTQAP